MKTQALNQWHINALPEQNRQDLLDKLTASAWVIAYSALWNGKKISLEKRYAAVFFINAFIAKTNAYEKNFEELIQRILIARTQFFGEGKKNRFSAAVWWETNEAKGFPATERLFEYLMEKRQHNEFYYSHWRDMGWAVYQCIPGAHLHFHRWRNYFSSINEQALNLFLACTANNNALWEQQDGKMIFVLR